jgi:ribosomal protein S18 acetylase RimI-like enzyme
MDIQLVLDAESLNLQELHKLLAQQSPGVAHELQLEDIQEALGNDNFFFLVAREGQNLEDRIVGVATIFFQRNLARWIAEIHDVVVDEGSRGQGTGEELVRALLSIGETFSKERNTNVKVYLTSRPSRVAANKLYQKLGFTLVAKATGDWGTNLYKKMIPL